MGFDEELAGGAGYVCNAVIYVATLPRLDKAFLVCVLIFTILRPNVLTSVSSS